MQKKENLTHLNKKSTKSTYFNVKSSEYRTRERQTPTSVYNERSRVSKFKSLTDEANNVKSIVGQMVICYTKMLLFPRPYKKKCLTVRQFFIIIIVIFFLYILYKDSLGEQGNNIKEFFFLLLYRHYFYGAFPRLVCLKWLGPRAILFLQRRENKRRRERREKHHSPLKTIKVSLSLAIILLFFLCFFFFIIFLFSGSATRASWLHCW